MTFILSRMWQLIGEVLEIKENIMPLYLSRLMIIVIIAPCITKSSAILEILFVSGRINEFRFLTVGTNLIWNEKEF